MSGSAIAPGGLEALPASACPEDRQTEGPSPCLCGIRGEVDGAEGTSGGRGRVGGAQAAWWLSDLREHRNQVGGNTNCWSHPQSSALVGWQGTQEPAFLPGSQVSLVQVVWDHL